MKRAAASLVAVVFGLVQVPVSGPGGITQLALPSQTPDAPPARPVGDPDVPPISIDFFEIDGIPLPLEPVPLEPAAR